jgi:hypothetical protein
MKLSRRRIAQLVAAAAVPALAQPQADSNDPVKRARDTFEKNSKDMAAVKIPMGTEPAFRFKA